jgi:predicted GIY-YIG superfamily endonuclease
MNKQFYSIKNLAAKMPESIFAVLLKINAALVKGLRRLPFTEPACVTQSGRESRVRIHFMVTVYVLESLITKKYYVGMTEDLTNRLKEHNAGRSKFTSAYKPWKVIYTEETVNFGEGRIREKYFKTFAGKKFIQKQLSLPSS